MKVLSEYLTAYTFIISCARHGMGVVRNLWSVQESYEK
jgi:hypothetical protein